MNTFEQQRDIPRITRLVGNLMREEHAEFAYTTTYDYAQGSGLKLCETKLVITTRP